MSRIIEPLPLGEAFGREYEIEWLRDMPSSLRVSRYGSGPGPILRVIPHGGEEFVITVPGEAGTVTLSTLPNPRQFAVFNRRDMPVIVDVDPETLKEVEQFRSHARQYRADVIEMVKQKMTRESIDAPVRLEFGRLRNDDTFDGIKEVRTNIWLVAPEPGTKRTGNVKVERTRNDVWTCGCKGWQKNRGVDCKHISRVRFMIGDDGAIPYDGRRRRLPTKLLYPQGPAEDTRRDKAREAEPKNVPAICAQLCTRFAPQPPREQTRSAGGGATGAPLPARVFALLMKVFWNLSYDQLRQRLTENGLVWDFGLLKAEIPKRPALIRWFGDVEMTHHLNRIFEETTRLTRRFDTMVVGDSHDIPMRIVDNSRDRKFGPKPAWLPQRGPFGRCVEQRVSILARKIGYLLVADSLGKRRHRITVATTQPDIRVTRLQAGRRTFHLRAMAIDFSARHWVRSFEFRETTSAFGPVAALPIFVQGLLPNVAVHPECLGGLEVRATGVRLIESGCRTGLGSGARLLKQARGMRTITGADSASERRVGGVDDAADLANDEVLPHEAVGTARLNESFAILIIANLRTLNILGYLYDQEVTFETDVTITPPIEMREVDGTVQAA